ncbi:hypothetical protein EVAR_51534_1 [Eumeta japonica]|uniref:Uncharacterized protein n=1 Tax=Eumeta variegata TaxID=151549 RepID=A0A4C1XAV1_EUMVA|nr:hypothetical protein EVAR_51534_1 [Eumeta japonica]
MLAVPEAEGWCTLYVCSGIHVYTMVKHFREGKEHCEPPKPVVDPTHVMNMIMNTCNPREVICTLSTMTLVTVGNVNDRSTDDFGVHQSTPPSTKYSICTPLGTQEGTNRIFGGGRGGSIKREWADGEGNFTTYGPRSPVAITDGGLRRPSSRPSTSWKVEQRCNVRFVVIT